MLEATTATFILEKTLSCNCKIYCCPGVIDTELWICWHNVSALICGFHTTFSASATAGTGLVIPSKGKVASAASAASLCMKLRKIKWGVGRGERERAKPKKDVQRTNELETCKHHKFSVKSCPLVPSCGPRATPPTLTPCQWGKALSTKVQRHLMTSCLAAQGPSIREQCWSHSRYTRHDTLPAVSWANSCVLGQGTSSALIWDSPILSDTS